MKRLLCICLSLILILSTSCTTPKNHPYGVFLSVDSDLDSLSSYDTVVIDAQNFTAGEIKAFRSMGHKVISYINIGSLESFRPYYDKYSSLALGPYEHWDEEVWIDVSSLDWQSFVIDELIPSLVSKDIDGFFVDNCDVYYNYPTPENLSGLTLMLKSMVSTGLEVIINGGDNYLDGYCASGGFWSDVITGINQETVFSSILWDEDSFETASDVEHAYFVDYVERYAALGADIYLLEYTTDKKLVREIDRYCKDHVFSYYVSDSVELD